jgi:hypothetical protein
VCEESNKDLWKMKQVGGKLLKIVNKAWDFGKGGNLKPTLNGSQN